MQIKLPLVINASDYHEFESMKDVLNKALVDDNSLIDKKYKNDAVDFKEIGLNEMSGFYMACFFDSTKQPTPTDIVKMVLLNNKGSMKNDKEVISELPRMMDSEIVYSVGTLGILDILKDLNKNNDFYKSSSKKLKK